MLNDMNEYLRKQGHSIRRFAYYFVLVGIAGVLLGLAGKWMDWSHGVSFAVTALVGSGLSLAALRENPINWFRGWGEAREKRARSSS